MILQKNISNWYLIFTAEFPFIAYYIINTTHTDPSTFYSNVRGASLSKFEPKITRYTAAHTLDIYSEVASICRPPLMLSEQTNLKKTPSTAYIISVYKVITIKILRNVWHKYLITIFFSGFWRWWSFYQYTSINNALYLFIKVKNMENFSYLVLVSQLELH